MSAFLVTDEHIHALLSFAVRPQWQSPSRYNFDNQAHRFFDEADAIGQKLIDENYRSLGARYGDPYEPHEYKFVRSYHIKTAVEIIKLCDCYDYQACETGEDYYKSEAHHIVTTIRGRAINELPGYDEAPWGI